MSSFGKNIKSSWEAEKLPKYPRVKKKDFKHWNESMFIKYTNERVYHHPNPLIRLVERKRVETLIKMLEPLHASDYILAAGCGEGYIERKIKKGKLMLVDISREAIRQAKKNLAGRRNIKFLVADLESLPFEAGIFDKIECSEVIEHVFSSQKMMSEIKRVLKKNGFLVITFPNEPLINFIKRIFIRFHIFNLFFPNVPRDMTEEWHLRTLDLNRFKELANENWRLICIKGVPFNFFPIRYVVKCKKN